MNTESRARQSHPGPHIKKHVLPPGLSVTAAAGLLHVGRPALSNLLNGKASLSPAMALRLQKAFGADSKVLLQLQAQFDQAQSASRSHGVTVRAYVPSFLKITARAIESWADGNVDARSCLPVLLRKLLHSTGGGLSRVDFPGYDNAQRKGWDGWVAAADATPWIPAGNSGWEFGCDKKPKKKAESDYTARVRDAPKAERLETHFVFVTPRNWEGKSAWAKGKQKLGEWKSVKAYDASDLEQWLEESIPAQGWMAEQIGLPREGAEALDSYWQRWTSAAQPALARELFDPSVKAHSEAFERWLKNAPSKPLVVCADSRDEALAFLWCMFDANGFAFAGYKDRAVVFSCSETARRLLSATSNLLPVVFTEEVERELAGLQGKLHAIIVRPRNTVEPKPDIELDLLTYDAFSKGLAAMGIVDNHRVVDLSRQSGRSPTILRRLLSGNPAIRTPPWAQDSKVVSSLVPTMLVGAWHSRSQADCEILSRLAGVSYEEIERRIARLLTYDDPPVWSTGHYRGVTSKIDSFFAIHKAIVQKDIDEFLLAARIVLSEADPALDLPEEKRAFASLYGKSRQHSRMLREGLCETLVLLSVHGDNLFGHRLGVDIQASVSELIRSLLTPLTPDRLLSQSVDLPLYAEAAPEEFLKIIDDDLRSPEPQIYSLMEPAGTGIFGCGCPRSGLLWALECLAWKRERLLPVSLILAKLAERKIEDNWSNKPDNSLLSIYRCWLPQTAASIEDRKRALESLTTKVPRIGWKICVDQFDAHSTVGSYNQRPRWRSDASGAGQLASRRELHEFARKALDLALAWPTHDEQTLGDLVSDLQGLPEEEGYKVWDLIERWAKETTDEQAKAILRERIRRFAFTHRGKQRGITGEKRDRAREVSDLLIPHDPVTRHEWLFKANWVESSADEYEDQAFDVEKSQAKVENERDAALKEIWGAQKFSGIHSLVSRSGAPARIGWHLAGGVIALSDATGFVRQCLTADGAAAPTEKMNELIRGFLMRLEKGTLNQVTKTLLATLSPAKATRLLQCSPFEHATWLHVDSQSPEIRASYWRDVGPGWIARDSPDINEIIDRLLAASRPRAAFNALQHSLEQIETSRLRRLVREVATSPSEVPGTAQVHAYDISSALDILQGQPGVTPDEMAQLEFLFIRALDDGPHGIPNLERQISESPALFAQVLALVYKRRDGGEDPEEWRIEDPERRASAAMMGHSLLRRVARIPGTKEDGTINIGDLKAWLRETRALCAKHGRIEIGDQTIGQLLATAPPGEDGIWPCVPVRQALEDMGTEDLATGISIGVYNSRGAHCRSMDAGGQPERDLAEKYRNYSRRLTFEYPYVARILEKIAAHYDRDATMEDSELRVRRRLMH